MVESFDRKPRPTAGSAAQWAIAGLLAAIAVLLAAELVFSPSPAVAQTGSAGAVEGVFAIAGQITGDSYGLYLVDLRNGTICVYEYAGRPGRLSLRAARTFIYDCQLDSYNTEPDPADIAEKVSRARRLRDVKGTPKP